MATIAIQRANFATPAAVAYTAAAGGGDKFANDGRTHFHVKNGGAGAVVVTVTAGASNANVCSFGVSGGTNHQVTYSIPAGEDRLLGPFDKDRFNDADGNVNVAYDGVTSVTVAALAS